jgi:hypothetical protein
MQPSNPYGSKNRENLEDDEFQELREATMDDVFNQGMLRG